MKRNQRKLGLYRETLQSLEERQARGGWHCPNTAPSACLDMCSMGCTNQSCTPTCALETIRTCPV